ncbi:MAG: DUF6491 family protein [Pseudomonadota bacterium]|nr:MAG: hypothetical protein DIU62_12910 [Pseudomonadota bacterium]
MHRIALAATAALLLMGCATTPEEDRGVEITGPEASVPFANQRSTIRTWQADGTRGIWVEDLHGNWYYGRFHGPCVGLPFATAVGFRTGSTGQLDRFSSVVVPGEGRCALASFVSTTEPPDNGKRRNGAEEPAE